MKKGYSKRFAFLFIVLLQGFSFLNMQCDNRTGFTRTVQGNSIVSAVLKVSDEERLSDCMFQGMDEEDKSEDSVVWNTSGQSAYLYKYTQDTTHYVFRNEYDHVLMDNYIRSEKVGICCQEIQNVFLNSLASLSGDPINAFLDKPEPCTPIVFTLLIGKNGTVKKVRFSFLRAKERCVPDSYIRRLDKKIRSIKFPSPEMFGLDFCKITLPVRESFLMSIYRNKLTNKVNGGKEL